jgi:hypothetical protein
MEQPYNPFIPYRVRVIDLKQWFHEEISNFHQRIIQGTENVEDIISRFVLGRKETIPLEKALVNVSGKVSDIENKLLIINNNMFLPLNCQVLALLDIRAQYF